MDRTEKEKADLFKHQWNSWILITVQGPAHHHHRHQHQARAHRPHHLRHPDPHAPTPAAGMKMKRIDQSEQSIKSDDQSEQRCWDELKYASQEFFKWMHLRNIQLLIFWVFQIKLYNWINYKKKKNEKIIAECLSSTVPFIFCGSWLYLHEDRH